jgi:preprotein translocase subunit SecD
LTGAIGLIWKDSRIKIASMVLLVAVAMLNIGINGLKYGIDFSGGTRIPIVLERSVPAETMSQMVDTIKTRVSVLGLSEVKVRAVGENGINVEIPSSSKESIDFIEKTLSSQGVFQGIVDGKIGVSGDRIYPNSIGSVSINELQLSGADWGVTFQVDLEGGQMFADAAKGKAQEPIYMFLDRPEDAVLIYENSSFAKIIPDGSSVREVKGAIEKALKLEENKSIGVYIISEINDTANLTPKTNATKAIVSKNLTSEIKRVLLEKGFKLVESEESKITPEISVSRAGDLFVGKLEAVGLLTAPILNGQITQGIPSYQFSISGPIPNKAALGDQGYRQAVLEQVKSVESILKGGSLPVGISIGSKTVLPAALGEEFLRLSLIGIAASLVLISLFVGFRYRSLSAAIPIILVSVGELIILISILGSFTIDLAAVAGILAALGVSVDAQIVITDELLKKDDEHHTTKEKVQMAFGIIKTNAIVAIFSMLPLMFSGLVEVIGFAISTILGALLGYMLTRPTYAAIVEEVLKKEIKEAQ